jgi:hypothetical protein
MNIVLIGSCLDSSNLAKELNKKMKNSVVFRIDLLKNLKNIIPFSTTVNENCGTYLGDIEKINFQGLTSSEKDIAKAFQSSVKLIEDNPSLSYALQSVEQHQPTIDRVTRNFDSLSLTLLRVVSGIQTTKHLDRYLRSNSSAIVVYLEKPNNPLFNIEISKEQFSEIKENDAYVNHLFLSATDLSTLLTDEVFNVIINPVTEKKGKIDLLAEETEKVGYIERSIVQQGAGILAQLQEVTVGTVGQGVHLTETMLDNFMNTAMTEPMPTPVVAETYALLAA